MVYTEKQREYQRQWYQKNKEKKDAQGRAYYEAHKEELNKRNLAYYYSHRNEMLEYEKEYRASEEGRLKKNAYMRAWRAKNLEKARQIDKAGRERHYWRLKENRRLRTEQLRHSLFTLIGLKCIRCDFADVRALQFDHINGDGKDEKIERGEKFYRFYLKNPEVAKSKLQTMCANCNWIKKHMKGERPYPNGIAVQCKKD